MATYTASHWGVYEVDTRPDGPSLRPYRHDPDPTSIGLDQLSEEVARLRIRRPAIRKGWLDDGPASRKRRGLDPFVEVSWERAIGLLAGALDRTIQTHGNEAIFGGSYGWSSSGRFHHPQGQVKRFLNCIGGFVRHQDSYSHAAANVVMPHIVAPLEELTARHTSWEVMAEHTQLFVAFGGVPRKNAQVTAGGAVLHQVRAGLDAMARNGARFVNLSPQRSDLDVVAEAEWIAIRPNTDTALLLGLCTTLIEEGLADRAFLKTHCVGFERVEAYLGGRADGQRRDARWASQICGLPERRIRDLALAMASHRTMINVAWSLQRADHGEQVYWALVTLAAMLGQIGLPGGGFGVGYGAVNAIGGSYAAVSGPTFPQGRNPVGAFIPVARIADMLLSPGGPFSYDGGSYTYPDIRLVYWAGGNPFHHHQDLNRLVEAWRRPETVVVNEQFWNPVAKMADIVLPATTSLERNDIGFTAREGHFVAMKQVSPAVGEACNDHDIFAELARHMNVGDAFTEGRDEMGWLRHLYDVNRARPGLADILPDFDAFWDRGLVELPKAARAVILLDDFRANPEGAPLTTPSGRIELFSERVAGFGYADCPGHAVWIEPREWLGAGRAATYPLHLLTNQPDRRLHSQLDHASLSVAGKRHGREPIQISRDDAAARGIADGDLVEVFNDRGRCLAAAVVTDCIGVSTVNLCTGAWFDPQSWDHERPLEKHGNPNVLTCDAGTSSLAQGCSAQTCLVDVRKFEGDPPPVTAFELPSLVSQESGGSEGAARVSR